MNIHASHIGAANAQASLAAPIKLEVAGGGLLLNGTFEHWTPTLMEQVGEGNTEGTSAAQLLVDVTSMPRGGSDQEPLFSFSSRSVQPLANAAYRARGTLRVGDEELEQELVLQTPEAHTPFFLVTMNLPNSQGAIWRAFRDSVSARDADHPEVRARAWLRAPDVAAA